MNWFPRKDVKKRTVFLLINGIFRIIWTVCNLYPKKRCYKCSVKSWVAVDISPLYPWLKQNNTERKIYKKNYIEQHQSTQNEMHYEAVFISLSSLPLFFGVLFWRFAIALTITTITCYRKKNHSISDSFHRHPINSFRIFFFSFHFSSTRVHTEPINQMNGKHFGVLSSGVHVIKICCTM